MPPRTQSSDDRARKPWTNLVARSPPPLIADPQSFSKNLNLPKLPIFKFELELTNLFNASLTIASPTDISIVQTHPYFTILRLIIWQVSNKTITYRELDSLLGKVETLNFLDAVPRLFSLNDPSVSAAAEMVIPTLYYRGNGSVALSVYKTQSYERFSLYHLLALGEEIANDIDHRPRAQINLPLYYELILSDILDLEAKPRTPHEAVSGFMACRTLDAPVARLIAQWDFLLFKPHDIDNYMAGEGQGAQSRAYKLSEGPLLHKLAGELGALLQFGLQDGLWFHLMSSLFNNNFHDIILYLKYSTLPDEMQMDLINDLQIAERSSNPALQAISLSQFQTILRFASTEITSYLFDSKISLVEAKMAELGLSLEDPLQTVAILMYYGEMIASQLSYVAALITQSSRPSLLEEDMTKALEYSVDIYRTYGDVSSPYSVGQRGYRDRSLAEKHFVSKRLEWLLCLGRETGISAEVSATHRLWEDINYLLKGFCGAYLEEDILSVQPSVKFIAALARHGAQLDDPKETEHPTHISMRHYLIRVAILSEKPKLFCFLLGQDVSLEPLKIWIRSYNYTKYVVNRALIQAAYDNDAARIDLLWEQRFITAPSKFSRCDPEPAVTKLSAALWRLGSTTGLADLKSIFLESLNVIPHPMITLTQRNPDWILDIKGPRDVKENVCFKVLQWLFQEYFEVANHGSVAGQSPVRIKCLHRQVMYLIVQKKRYWDLFDPFFRYGAVAELLPDNNEYSPLTFDHGPSFMNINFRMIHQYAAYDFAMVRSIVGAGYNINQTLQHYKPLLMTAILQGNMNMVVWLLERGASIFIEADIGPPQKAIRGNSAELAVIEGRINMVALFLESDSSCKERALEMATRENQFAIVSMINDWRPGAPSPSINATERVYAVDTQSEHAEGFNSTEQTDVLVTNVEGMNEANDQIFPTTTDDQAPESGEVDHGVVNALLVQMGGQLGSGSEWNRTMDSGGISSQERPERTLSSSL